jgi:hypothetical protein
MSICPLFVPNTAFTAVIGDDGVTEPRGVFSQSEDPSIVEE